MGGGWGGGVCLTGGVSDWGRVLLSKWDRVSGESLEHEAESLEREDEQRQLTRETLQVLTEMHIRFPGKTTEQAELILDTVRLTAHTRATTHIILDE